MLSNRSTVVGDSEKVKGLLRSLLSREDRAICVSVDSVEYVEALFEMCSRSVSMSLSCGARNAL